LLLGHRRVVVRARRVHLKVKSRRLHSLLLVSGEAGKAVVSVKVSAIRKSIRLLGKIEQHQ
jgi:hypothetical protein